MIDAPRWQAAHQPLNRRSQPLPGSFLVGITSPAPGSHLVGQDCALTQAEVIVETVDGSILRRRHDCGIPTADLSAQQTRLEAKFGSIARPLLDEESGDEVLQLIGRLEELPDLSPLAGLLAGQPPRGLRH